MVPFLTPEIWNGTAIWKRDCINCTWLQYEQKSTASVFQLCGHGLSKLTHALACCCSWRRLSLSRGGVSRASLTLLFSSSSICCRRHLCFQLSSFSKLKRINGFMIIRLCACVRLFVFCIVMVAATKSSESQQSVKFLSEQLILILDRGALFTLFYSTNTCLSPCTFQLVCKFNYCWCYEIVYNSVWLTLHRNGIKVCL